jgi:hypothetical protein
VSLRGRGVGTLASVTVVAVYVAAVVGAVVVSVANVAVTGYNSAISTSAATAYTAIDAVSGFTCTFDFESSFTSVCCADCAFVCDSGSADERECDTGVFVAGANSTPAGWSDSFLSALSLLSAWSANVSSSNVAKPLETDAIVKPVDVVANPVELVVNGNPVELVVNGNPVELVVNGNPVEFLGTIDGGGGPGVSGPHELIRRGGVGPRGAAWVGVESVNAESVSAESVSAESVSAVVLLGRPGWSINASHWSCSETLSTRPQPPPSSLPPVSPTRVPIAAPQSSSPLVLARFLVLAEGRSACVWAAGVGLVTTCCCCCAGFV